MDRKNIDNNSAVHNQKHYDKLVEPVASLLKSIEKCSYHYAYIQQYGLLDYYVPFLTRTTPRLSILQFKLDAASIKCYKSIAAHTVVYALKDTTQRYSLSSSLLLNPLQLLHCHYQCAEGMQSTLSLKFITLKPTTLSDCQLESLLIYLDMDFKYAAQALDNLLNGIDKIILTVAKQRYDVTNKVVWQLPVDLWYRSLLPINNTANPLSILHDFSCLPQKFFFITLMGLQSLKILENQSEFDLKIIFSNQCAVWQCPSQDIAIKLHCVPAVALWPASIEPIHLQGCRGEYKLRVAEFHPQPLKIYTLRTLQARDAQGCCYGLHTEVCLPVVNRQQAIGYVQWQPGTVSDREPQLYVSLDKVIADLWLSATVWVQAVSQADGNLQRSLTLGNSMPSFKIDIISTLFPGDVQPLKMQEIATKIRWLATDYMQLFNQVECLKCFLNSFFMHTPLRTFIEGLLEVSVKSDSCLFRQAIMPVQHLRFSLQAKCYINKASMKLWSLILYYYYLSCVPMNTLVRLSVYSSDRDCLFTWFDECQVL